jgi:hypothetical protein
MDPFLENATLVNNHLEAAGLPSPLLFGSSQPEDIAKVIQCVFSLLSQRQVNHEGPLFWIERCLL